MDVKSPAITVSYRKPTFILFEEKDESLFHATACNGKNFKLHISTQLGNKHKINADLQNCHLGTGCN